ncbi:kynureninase [Sphingosinicella sp. LHD-64]|uniref:kynureninase n=1 Tax=Sphingosinicella sp. LHD-64 TaxID=3072139 RepID=UPI00280E8A97|nr:kynureninase [Sphingosinicella sp. LHD-64]MDQ8758190.1 kynureninase [Sphingosinicella sp. LHD-64]
MSFTLAEAKATDAADPLRSYRERFHLPEGVIYLDGNSLGALPRATVARQQEIVAREWGESLIRGWNVHGWIGLPQRVGARIAPLIGARPHEVIVADSTSVNLFKLLVAAVRLSDRPVLLSESGNFHTDLHIASGVADLTGLRLDIAPRAKVEGRIGSDTNLVLLTHVHYKTAERFDMAAVTARTHKAGARIVWDLSHSVGAVPLDLNGAGVELAVGCGYKYLNGGPGAPAFLYIAEALQEQLLSPLRGWMGHAEPFAFTDDYRPAPGIDRFLAGTPPILGIAALESGLDAFDGLTIERLWSKSRALFDVFYALMEQRCPELTCITPRGEEQRGSHISFAHPHAFEICQALIADGVIGDFRAPDVVRFGLTPLYLGFEDIWHAVDRLARILKEDGWRDPKFAVRSKVT